MKIKYKIGDAVRFLNETGGGVITRFDDQNLAFVETEDGFEIPVQLEDLIPARGFSENSLFGTENEEDLKSDLKSEIKPKPVQDEKQPDVVSLPRNVDEDAIRNVLIGFVPERKGPVFSNTLECYLINDSGFHLYYMLGTFEKGRYFYLSSGMLEADMKYYIKSFNQTEISKISGLHFQAIWVSDGRYFKQHPIDEVIDLSLVNFSKEHNYQENDYFDYQSVLFPVVESQTDSFSIPDGLEKEDLDLQGNKIRIDKKGSVRKKKQTDETYEADLHVEQVIENPQDYKPSEILSIQIRKMHQAMEDAISLKKKRIVIIHGVGQGTLKMEIRKELQDKYPEYEFQDASFKEYGFGATMVHLHIIKKQ